MKNQMKRVIFFALAMLVTMIVSGQELQVRSFRLAENDISAVKYQRLDLNGQPCALIKVGLGVQGAKFPGTEVVGDVKYDTSEYWVYVVNGTRKLKVMCPGFPALYLNFADYQADKLEGAKTYILTLVGSGQESTASTKDGDYVIINVTPASANVVIDDQLCEGENGLFSKYLTNGPHNVKVSAAGFSSEEKQIIMESEKQRLDVTLTSTKARVDIGALTRGTSIYIDDKYKGVDSWNGELFAGSYIVEGRKDGFNTYSTKLSLSENEKKKLTLPELTPIKGTVTIDYKPIDSDVWLDGKMVGNTPLILDNVLVGNHRIEIKKDGFAKYEGSVKVEKGLKTEIKGELQREKKAETSRTISEDIEEFNVNGVIFRMVKVEGGSFKLGATNLEDCWDDERSICNVTLPTYYIGETEVTQALWKAVMNNNPSYFKGDSLPVEQVSFYDCLEFIDKLNALTNKKFRLPSASEWEIAARGGLKSRNTKYSGSNNIEEVAWYKGNSNDSTHPVATKKANELGIYDMSGNVEEWCDEWYNYFRSANNPVGHYYNDSYSYANEKETRGGNWNVMHRSNRPCCVSSRSHTLPKKSTWYLGFRLVLIERDIYQF